jgi:hypothetical protein
MSFAKRGIILKAGAWVNSDFVYFFATVNMGFDGRLRPSEI